MRVKIKSIQSVVVSCSSKKDAKRLFAFFTNVLELPLIWKNNSETQYCIGITNCCIEVCVTKQRHHPYFSALSFEPTNLSEALHSLRTMHLQYMAPVFSNLDFKSNRKTINNPDKSASFHKLGYAQAGFANIFIHEHRPTKLNPWQTLKLKFISFFDGFYKNTDTMHLICDFNPQVYDFNEALTKSQSKNKLGITQFKRIFRTAADIDRTHRFYTKLFGHEIDDNTWQVGNSPFLKTYRPRQLSDKISKITLEVEDFAQAKSVLLSKGCYSGSDKNTIFIDKKACGGLNIELEEKVT